jgi:hypothetical protein
MVKDDKILAHGESGWEIEDIIVGRQRGFYHL